MTLPFRPLALVGVVALITIGGCTRDTATPSTSTSDSSTSSSVTSAPSSTSTAKPTTTDATPPPATTNAPTPATTVGATTTDSESPVAEGSGCAPGPGTLPDGTWYGRIVDADDSTIEFDLMCFFLGDDAAIAAAQDGEESPPPNDYHVRNDSPVTRVIPIASTITVTALNNANNQISVSYADWLSHRIDDFTHPVWIDTVSGEIVVIEEQYLP